MKKLVAYFSATGVTAKAANDLSEAIGADVFEIQPAERYTKADLDWKDEMSRSSLEMNDPTARPQLAAELDHMDEYDVIYVGFPLWWYVAPRIINTFLESYDLTGKMVIPFATSGGSGVEKVNESLRTSCAGAVLMEPHLLNDKQALNELAQNT